MKKKMIMMINHSIDDHDKANIALAFATTMLSEDFDLALVFIFDGVLLAKKGVAETIEGRNVTPAKDLFPMILEAKIPMYACAPCAKTFGVSENDLVEGVRIVSSATVVSELEDREVLSF